MDRRCHCYNKRATCVVAWSVPSTPLVPMRCSQLQPAGRARPAARPRCAACIASVAAADEQRRTVQQLSTVMLVNENLNRQLGRPLVERQQLDQALQLVDSASYALLVVAGPQQQQQQQQLAAALDPSAATWRVLYANHAAAAALAALADHHQQQQQQQLSHVRLSSQLSALHHHQQQEQQQGASMANQVSAVLGSCCALSDVVCQLAHDQQQQPQEHLEQQRLLVPQLLAWPVYAPNDAYLGLALLFDSWAFPADGSSGAPGWPRVCRQQLPDEQQLEAAAAAVRSQAEAVRQLKAVAGLSNKDPAVMGAVAELQALKQQLSRLEGLAAAFLGEGPQRHSTLQQLLQLLTRRKQ